jgi:MoaA/NifB/PqqE/SkfB family radical SAM enzyme
VNLIDKKYDMVIHWEVTRFCNFRCFYCIAKAKTINKNISLNKININALSRFLKEINKTAMIIFTGGEPLLIENIIEVFSEITQNHYIMLITNLVNPKIAQLAEKINPEKVICILASVHLHELTRLNLLDTFISNYNLLKRRGFIMFAEEVAHPSIFSRVEYYKKIFKDNDIDLRFIPFRGKWDNKIYPFSYTDEEKKVFDFGYDTIIGNDKTDFTKWHKRKKCACNAGYNVFVALPKGTIRPCYKIKINLGNIYKSIKPLKKIINCPFSYCDAPISAFDPQLLEQSLLENNYK